MMFFRLHKTYRHLQRYRQIFGVLLRYGFQDVVERLRIDGIVRVSRKMLRGARTIEQLGHMTTAQRLRMALAELGPTFIKLGQVLSTRPDLVPLDLVKELEKLQDQVPPFPTEDAKQMIVAQFGHPIDQIFSSFSEIPIASASIAQVHRATLRNGQTVAVKIQRPGIKATIEADISILQDLANWVEKYIPESELYNPTGIVNEFAKTIRAELDFVREGRNIDRFRTYFKNDPTIYLPKVYWQYTTSSILTMEFINGVKVSEVNFASRPDLDPKIIALNGAKATLKMIFDLGFFHADPHPGNIFILPNNVLAPLDFGMVGRFDAQTKRQLQLLLIAIAERDIDRIVKVFIDADLIDETKDTRLLRIDLNDFIETYYGIPLHQISVEKLFNDLIEILRRHQIPLLSDLVLMTKALATIESVGLSLDPNFNMMTLVEPYASRLMAQPLHPKKRLKTLQQIAAETEELVKILPGDLRYILGKIKKGRMNMIFEHRGLEQLIIEIDRSSNRLAFSLIIAALIVGSSIIIFFDKGWHVFGFSVFGLIGYVIAAVLGLWLAIAILRSGKL